MAATSRRHQVMTSSQQCKKSAIQQRRDATTSRRHHVATSPRRDATTSRRHHVATSAQKSTSHHLMIEGSKIRASGSVRGEARISKARGSRLREIARDSYHFPFLLDIIEDMMMMFLILDTLFFSFMMF